MGVVQTIVLGIIQGLSEFLPISSSGHLVLVPKLFGWSDQGATFDAMIHLGTLIAVLVYFRTRIILIIKSVLNKNSGDIENRKLFWLIVIATIPAGIIGFFFGDCLESYFRAPLFIALNLIFFGLILGLADWYAKKHSNTEIWGINNKNALVIGLVQAVALVPGVSRSGITMTAGLFSKISKKSAAEFSFLMSIPVIVLAGGAGLVKTVSAGNSDWGWGIIIGLFTAVISGYLAIGLLMKVISKWNFWPFVVYRVILGIVILCLLL